MKRSNRKFLSLITVILILCNVFPAWGADETDLEKELLESLNTQNIEGSEDSEFELDENGLPIGYDQSVIDALNNNSNYADISAGYQMSESADMATDTIEQFSDENNALPSETNKDKTNELSEAQEEPVQMRTDAAYSVMATSGTVAGEFMEEPINAPFYVNDGNESISLATGGMVYSQNLISLPGRNELDLNLSVKYNSDNAVITKNEFDKDANTNVINFNQFAIGWSFGFTNIQKSKSKSDYGYKKETTVNFSDGSSYKIKNDSDNITADQTLTLEHYQLEDITIVRKADTKEYVITYTDGRKEFFDGTYGNITKLEDRFGNNITFEYEEIDYFRGTFIDYIFNPSVYMAKLNILKSITDSIGRKITVNYNITSTGNGKVIKDISFKLNNKTFAQLFLNKMNSYNGQVDVLKSITVGTGLVTSFDYEERLSSIYTPDVGNGESLNVNSSCFTMTQVNYPTGGYTKYEYQKARRSYCFYIPQVVFEGWYDVYKVSASFRSDGVKTEYQYEGDQSGYPYSHLKTDVYSEPTGDIYDTSVTYHTIVKKNGAVTIHSFDYQHKKTTEQTYDNTSINKYIHSAGDSQWNVVVNNVIYRIYQRDKLVSIFKQSDYDEEPILLQPYELSQTVQNVKTYGNNIYIFYREGAGITNSPYKYSSIQYATNTGVWSNAGSIEIPTEYNNKVNLNNMYFTGNTFYCYGVVNKGYSTDALYHVIYNPTKDINNRWQYQKASNGSFRESYAFSHICSYNGKIYYKNHYQLIEYDISNNIYEKKTFSAEKFDSTDSVAGFEAGGKTYLYTYKYMYQFDYTKGTLTEISMPTDLGMNIVDRLQKGADGNMYYFSTKASTASNPQAIYRFDVSNYSWTLISYKLFSNTSFAVLMGYNTAYLTLGNKSGLNTSSNMPRTNEGGFERVNLNTNVKSYTRSRVDYTYNIYKQPTATKTTVFSTENGKSQMKTLYTESTNYLSKRSVLSSLTDRLGNKTTYTYTNSPYYLPTAISISYANCPSVSTTNTLDLNGKRIKSSSFDYKDGRLDTNYTYSGSYPGNVIKEVVTDIKNGVTTQISDIEYQYNTDPGCYGEAYVTRKTVKNVQTNGDNYNKEKSFDQVTNYTYDYYTGLLKSATDTLGRTTSYEYDANHWPTKTTYPDGTYTQISYNVDGTNNTIKTSYNGEYSTINHFDDLGRVSEMAEIGPGEQEHILQRYTYTDGNVSKVQDALNNQTGYTYDTFNRIVYTYTSNDNGNTGLTTSISYNDYDLTKTVRKGNNESETTVYYDVAGRTIKQSVQTDVGLNTISTAYDSKNNVISITDAQENKTTNTYNNLSQLTQTKNALNEVTKYTYDPFGNVSSVMTPGGSVSASQYDSLGRLLSTTDALGNSAYYTYDNIGNLIKSKDRKGQTAVFEYDNMNRLLSQSKGNESITYTYDTFGNVKTVTNTAGTTSYNYTYNNLLQSITTPDNKTISYQYDLMGNVIGVNDYNSRQLQYTYNSSNQIASVSSGGTTLATYQYTLAGNLANQTTPAGTTQYTYGKGSRLKSVINKSNTGETVNSYNYTYDILGRQTAKTDNGQTTQYTYDKLSRLTKVIEPNSTTTNYTFDKNSNTTVKSVTHPAEYEYAFKQGEKDYVMHTLAVDETTYAYDANNRLLSETRYVGGDSETYSGFLEEKNQNTYDANGNLVKTEKGGQVDAEVTDYFYDGWNRLREITGLKAGKVTYEYNADGMRTAKKVGNNMTKFYWDRGYIINEAEGNFFTANNTIGAQGIFGRVSNNQTSYMFKNGHGDVTSLVSDGEVVQNYDYDAYGVEKNPAENDTNPFRYSGEYYDDETEMYYLRARYYNPSNGRFITEDPVQDGLNWYVYCTGNPISFVDPLGLKKVISNVPFMHQRDQHNFSKITIHPSTKDIFPATLDNDLFVEDLLSRIEIIRYIDNAIYDRSGERTLVSGTNYCWATSAAMIANYYGANVGVMDVYSALLPNKTNYGIPGINSNIKDIGVRDTGFPTGKIQHIGDYITSVAKDDIGFQYYTYDAGDEEYRSSNVSLNMIKKAIDSNNLVFLIYGNSESAQYHDYVVVGYDNNNLVVHDPWDAQGNETLLLGYRRQNNQGTIIFHRN